MTTEIHTAYALYLCYALGMDTEIAEKLLRIEHKIDTIHASVEKTRKYFLITTVVTFVAFVVPLVGLMFAAPSLFSSPALL